MKKPLAVVVILLFMGVAFAPSINANISKASIDSEMVEFTTEVCGLNGGKQTVKLTKEQAEEVEALFESIRERLNATERREEAEEIFRDGILVEYREKLIHGLDEFQHIRKSTETTNLKDIIRNFIILILKILILPPLFILSFIGCFGIWLAQKLEDLGFTTLSENLIFICGLIWVIVVLLFCWYILLNQQLSEKIR